mmetsp:Transcript_13385/g.22818  ORF Transcript_13385/g.22818 Transcript_13385/m.22818 type:complete len:89 (-) Transcript_13385:1079-1345(-)
MPMGRQSWVIYFSTTCDMPFSPHLLRVKNQFAQNVIIKVQYLAACQCSFSPLTGICESEVCLFLLNFMYIRGRDMIGGASVGTNIAWR